MPTVSVREFRAKIEEENFNHASETLAANDGRRKLTPSSMKFQKLKENNKNKKKDRGYYLQRRCLIRVFQISIGAYEMNSIGVDLIKGAS